MKNSDKVNNKLLKIGPHILYTLFVVTFIYMMSVNQIKINPMVNGWAASKLGGFVFYVLSIAFALKWAKSNVWRFAGLISAIFWLVMSAKLGFAHHMKVKGMGEETTAYIDYAQSMIAAVC